MEASERRVSGWRWRWSAAVRPAARWAHSLQAGGPRQKPDRPRICLIRAIASRYHPPRHVSSGPMTTGPLPPPIPNSYWVRARPAARRRISGLDVARRRHGARADAAARRHHQLHRSHGGGRAAGVRDLLPELTEQRVRYRRLPILDHGLPDSPGAHDADPRPASTASSRAGRCVYVHCHAGIGRTGTAMGCHLDARRPCRTKRRSSACRCCGSNARVRAAGRRSGDRRAGRLRAALAGAAVGRRRSWTSLPRSKARWSVSRSATRWARWSPRATSTPRRSRRGMRDAAVLTTGANTAMTRAVAESLLAVVRRTMRRIRCSATCNGLATSAAPACRPS